MYCRLTLSADKLNYWRVFLSAGHYFTLLQLLETTLLQSLALITVAGDTLLQHKQLPSSANKKHVCSQYFLIYQIMIRSSYSMFESHEP